MKKKTESKVEMKEKVLSGNALALDDADLEGAAGGIDPDKFREELRKKAEEESALEEQKRRKELEEALAMSKAMSQKPKEELDKEIMEKMVENPGSSPVEILRQILLG